MKKILIVEDNREAVEALKKIISEMKEDVEVHVADDCGNAKQIAINNAIDIFIVDVILNQTNPNDASGLDFVQFIRGFKRYEFSPVIITTTVTDLKIYAYDVLGCCKYLEKPYDHDKAYQTIEKTLRMPLNDHEEQYLHIRSEGIVNIVKTDEIICILYANRRLIIYTVNKSIQMYYKSLSFIQKQLQGHNFVRCSGSAIINKDYVEAVDIKEGKIYLKKMLDPVKIGRSYRKKVVDILLG